MIPWDLQRASAQDPWSADIDHPAPVSFGKSSVAFHEPSGLLVLGGDGFALVWDVSARRFRGELTGHGTSTVYPAISREGSTIVTAGNDARILLWDAHDLTLFKELRPLQNSAFSVGISPDGRRVAVGRWWGDTSTVSIIDVLTGREIMSLPSPSGITRQVAWSPDGTALVARTDGGAIWTTRTITR